MARRYLDDDAYDDVSRHLGSAINQAVDTLTPRQALLTGVEWELFRRQLDSTPRPFAIVCSAHSAPILVALAEAKHRFVEERPIDTEAGVEIWVGTAIPNRRSII